MKKAFILGLVLAAATSALAGSKTLLNADKSGVAIKGYDPVAYFTSKQAVKGNPQLHSAYKGATYYFASADNKTKFDAEPAKYEPQFGGYCAYAASRGYTADISPDAFEILNGRLLLQYSQGALEKFNKDPQGNLKKADQNWPGLIEKYGR